MAILRFLLPGGLIARLTFDTTEADRRWAEMHERARHARPFWAEVGNICRRAFRRNFEAGGMPPWKPLAASTVARKSASGLPGDLRTRTGKTPKRLMQRGSLGASTILVESGTLRDAWCRRGARGNLSVIRDDGGEFGVNGAVLPYAAVHEFGGRGAYTIRARGSGVLAFTAADGSTVFRRSVRHPPLPRRPVGVLNDEDRKVIGEALAAHLLGRRTGQEGDGA